MIAELYRIRFHARAICDGPGFGIIPEMLRRAGCTCSQAELPHQFDAEYAGVNWHVAQHDFRDTFHQYCGELFEITTMETAREPIGDVSDDSPPVEEQATPTRATRKPRRSRRKQG